MKPGDLVEYVNDSDDIGLVLRVYHETAPDIFNIDVLWCDGIWTIDVHQCEVISEGR